jgi:protein-tyrosine phosphatase
VSVTGATDVFRIAFICTGNRFRSPLAQYLTRALAPDVALETSSFGLRDVAGSPVLPEAATEARRLRLDVSAHQATSLAGQRLENADLVIGFERIHVATAVLDAGAVKARTFTLPELVELLEEIDAPLEADPLARARAALVRAEWVRRHRPNPSVFPELGDPWGASPEIYVETGARVEELCRRLVRGLFGEDSVRAEAEVPERG